MKKYFILTNIVFFISTVVAGEFLLFVAKIIANFYSIPKAINALYQESAVYLLILFIIGVSYFLYLLSFLVRKLIRSERYDLLFTICFGLILFFCLNFQDYTVILALKELAHNHLLFLLVLILSIGLIIPFVVNFVDSIKSRKGEQESPKSTLLRDEPLGLDGKDLFGYKELADRFSNMVLGNYSSKGSLVFGLEAPWGTGKTTFLNMFESEWGRKNDGKSILIKFDPWHFDSSSELIRKFFDELKKAFNQRYYLPEINKLLREYLRVIHSIDINQLSLKLSTMPESLDKAHSEISDILDLYKVKIIVIIDDLDRSPLEISKQIFRLISICANFPYLNYIVCYDPDNLISGEITTTKGNTEGSIAIGGSTNEIVLRHYQEYDSSNIQTYLEKIINIKYILPYYKKDVIIDLLDETFYELILKSEYRNIPGKAIQVRRKFRHAIERIFYNYPTITNKYIKTIRHVKNILNTFISIKEDNRGFSLYDIGKIEVLILLVVLKYHYPKVYSDICYYEINRKPDYWSLPQKYCFTPASHYPENLNHGYKQYLDDHSFGPTLHVIFDVIFNDRNELLTNGQLIQYIKFIEGINVDELTDSILFDFFLSRTSDISFGGSILELFQKYITEVFIIDENEINSLVFKSNITTQFFNKLGDKLRDINGMGVDYSKKLIIEIVKNMPQYSQYPGIDNISSYIENTRLSMALTLAKILEHDIWDSNRTRNNSYENTKIISHYILGDQASGIGSIFSQLTQSRGVLGIYDMLLVHDYCVDQEMFNISRSLAWHSLSQNGSVGVTEDQINNRTIKDTYEEISQKTFEMFKREFIDPKRNFLAEVSALNLSDCVGTQVESESPWLKAITEESEYLSMLEVLKSRIEGFVINTLSIDDIDYIHCGNFHYDGIKIKDQMQDYLFDCCFAREDDNMNGYKFFIDFVLKQYVSSLGVSRDYFLNLQNLYKILDKDRLKKYWEEHGAQIKEYFKGREGYVRTPSYIASYSEDLTNDKGTGLFDIFDRDLA